MLYELGLISDSDSRNGHLNEYRIQQTQLTTTTFNILAQPVELYTGTSY